MKLHILSDLHIEFGKFRDPDVARDLTILAGDIAEGAGARNLVTEMHNLSPVVYVAGNHEYYGGAITGVDARWRAILGDYFLQMTSLDFNGLKIAGCTLWTDFDSENQAAMEAANQGMSDFRAIHKEKRPYPPGQRGDFRAQDAAKLNKTMVEWLLEQKADVIVTHHAPTLKSIHPKYVGDALNPAFASNLEFVVEATGARLWVHGHVHQAWDYMLGNCRIVCNPRGYTGYEKVNGFRPDLIVEI